MFKTKYNITLLDSKWNTIKTNVKFNYVPSRTDYVYIDEIYYKVLTVIHQMRVKQEIFLILDILEPKGFTE
jgi:hypothetical protein